MCQVQRYIAFSRATARVAPTIYGCPSLQEAARRVASCIVGATLAVALARDAVALLEELNRVLAFNLMPIDARFIVPLHL